MSEPGDLPDRQFDDEPPKPNPWWRRPRVWLAMAAAAVLLAFVFSRGLQHQPPPPGGHQETAIADVVPYQKPPEPPSPPAPPPAPKLPVTFTAPPPPIPTFPSQVDGVGRAPARPIMLSYVVPHSEGSSGGPVAAGDPEGGKTQVKASPSTIPGLKASPAVDDTYQLNPGILSCVLDTAIDSSLPGPLMCHLPGPVYSEKGVELMEAGTQIIGSYQSMTHQGESRLFATSLYARTPHNIWVPLDGQPMVDDLGRAGLDGEINNRYWERFGGAVLLDLSQMGLQIAQAKVAQAGNTYLNFNSSDNLANQILQNTINVPPLFTKHQGETIGIFITKPIFFNDSYRIQASQ